MFQLSKNHDPLTRKPAFTLIEVIVTLSVFSILVSLISINLIRPQKTASINSSTQTLISDIKSQQINSMQGNTAGQASSQKHGLFISPNKYTLFSGNSYSPMDSNNFEIMLEGDLQLSTTFPSSTLLFEKINGEVTNFNAGQNTITLTSPSGGQSKTITVNVLGNYSLN